MPLNSNKNFENNTVIFLHQTKVRTQIIYVITLLFVVSVLVALPFIYTTVSVRGTGTIQSNIERAELTAPVSGKITTLNLSDNKKVVKDKLLFSIDPSLPEKQNLVLNSRTAELLDLQRDVTQLLFTVDLSGSQQPKLQTGLYLAGWQQYQEQLHNALNAKAQNFKIFKRYETLFNKKVVTESEYEQYKFNYDQAVSDLNMVTKKYKSQWQVEFNQYKKELKDIEGQKIQLTEQEKLYQVYARISGTVQNLTGLQVGSFVSANQKIAEISPDSSLLAVCYVKPSDIGLIKKGQKLRLQIDAFNYNQWGMVSGKVLDIADDIIMMNQTPYFKVKCKVDQEYLKLKNGYKGFLKRGMTFNAHFTVAERSLYQLLYDKIDDWLNPSS